MWSLALAQENLWTLTEALISIKPPVYQQNNLKKNYLKESKLAESHEKNMYLSIALLELLYVFEGFSVLVLFLGIYFLIS